MYVASERPDLVRGMCLLNCVGGMNQRGLYKDSVQLLLMRPMFELFEFLLKKKNIANYLLSKFRWVLPDYILGISALLIPFSAQLFVSPCKIVKIFLHKVGPQLIVESFL